MAFNKVVGAPFQEHEILSENWNMKNLLNKIKKVIKYDQGKENDF